MRYILLCALSAVIAGCSSIEGGEVFHLVRLEGNECALLYDSGAPVIMVASSGKRAAYGVGRTCPRELPGHEGIDIWKRESITPNGKVVRMVSYPNKSGVRQRSVLRVRAADGKRHGGKYVSHSLKD